MKNNIKQILLFNFFHSELFEKLSLISVDCHLLISSQKACRVQHFVISHHHHPKVRIAFDKSKSTLPGGGSWPVKAFLIDFAWIVCCEPADEGGVCYEYRARCDGEHVVVWVYLKWWILAITYNIEQVFRSFIITISP